MIFGGDVLQTEPKSHETLSFLYHFLQLLEKHEKESPSGEPNPTPDSSTAGARPGRTVSSPQLRLVLPAPGDGTVPVEEEGVER